MEFQVFLEVAMAINERFRIIPMLYGSLGLERRINANLKVNDVDIIVPERYLSKYWEKLYDLMIKIGFNLCDICDFTFERAGVKIKFYSFESMLELANVHKTKNPREKAPVEYYLLDVNEYLTVYKATNENGKYDEKIQLIENVLKRDEIHKIRLFLKKICETDGLNNEYSHYVRVANMAKKLANSIGANEYVVELSALLYDLASVKNIENRKNYTIDKLLKNEFVTDDELNAIKNTVSEFILGNKPRTKECKCLYDAYNLDYIGAVGIANGFIQNAKKELPMYQVDSIPVSVMDDLYKESRDAFEHFTMMKADYKKRFYTDMAKAIAKERIAFMQSYLYQFYDECDGII